MNKIFLPAFLLVLACSTLKQPENSSGLIQIPVPSRTASGEPYLFTDASGKVYLSWIEVGEGKNQLKFSTLENDVWSAPKVISLGKDWFVNWADYPMLASSGNEMIAHFLGKSGEGKFAYDVMTTFSHDAGTTWSEPHSLHDDGLEAEHGFVSMIPYDSNYFISWLDGRNTVMKGMEHHEGHHGQMSIRGAIVDVNGKKLNEWELDNRTCDCCQTISVNTTNGPVVIYRDRSDEEIRDMSIVRFVNGEWTAPTSIYNDNWKIAGCPVNGPRADAIGNTLSIAWFSMQEESGNVKVIFSADGGATFEKPIRIDEGKTIGRVDIVMLDENHVMVSWMEGSEINAIKVARDGSLNSPITIASTSESRSSGFPQMTKMGPNLVFAWTDDKEKVIKSAMLKY